MYVDLWGWFQQEELRAYRERDETVKHIITLARQGWVYRRSAESSLMLACFEDAADLARQHQNPCLELFCTYWACSTLFYHIDDLKEAMHRTVELTARAHQPHFKQCPIRSRVYFLLADIYYEIDVFGYEDKIRESLLFLENEIPMDEDTHFRLLHRLAELSFLHGDYDDAFERVTHYMAQAHDNAFRMRSAHQLLRMIAFARGDIGLAYHHAMACETFSREIQSHVDVAITLFWQAALLQRKGEDSPAKQCYFKGRMIYEMHDLPRWVDYYDAQCDYLESIGQPQVALEKRQQQIEDYTPYGSVFFLSIAHLQYCRLLGRTGQDCSVALDAARAICADMLKPAHYQQQLQMIADGNYYQYDWQCNPDNTLTG